MIKDSYRTIVKPSQGEYREKGSKFFCYLFPVTNKTEIEEALTSVKKQHPKARHFCSAYGLGIDFEPNMVNDDGEPSGSAGRPILGQFKKYEISDVFAVVVRYFGGTKLGIPGLIKACKTATMEAIEANEIIDKVIAQKFELIAGYEQMGHILESVKKTDLKLFSKNFDSGVHLIFEIPKSQTDVVLHKLKAYLLKINPAELKDDLHPTFVEIKELFT